MSNPLEDKTRIEYWVHKLKSEVKFVQTNKNELAIKEFCEDIIQDAVGHGTDVNETLTEMKERFSSSLNNVRMSVDATREVNTGNAIEIGRLSKDVRDLTKKLLYGSLIVGAISVLTLIVVLANG